jgi:hypothetical protein
MATPVMTAGSVAPTNGVVLAGPHASGPVEVEGLSR